MKHYIVIFKEEIHDCAILQVYKLSSYLHTINYVRFHYLALEEDKDARQLDIKNL